MNAAVGKVYVTHQASVRGERYAAVGPYGTAFANGRIHSKVNYRKVSAANYETYCRCGGINR